MKKTFLTSSIIAFGILAWLMSGYLGRPDIQFAASLAEQNSLASKVEIERPPTKVRVKPLNATPKTRFAVIRGKTKNKRTVNIKSETSGLVEARLIAVSYTHLTLPTNREV